MALARGLELAKELHIDKLEIQLDSISCTQTIQGNEEVISECARIINRYRKLIKTQSWEIKVFHVFREGNHAADWLANQGVRQDDRGKSIDTIPLELFYILKEDIQGVDLPCLIPT